MGKPTIEQIKQIVAADNPKLMILTNDVYGTFVPAFRSLFTGVPTQYSFVSILILNTFGATEVGVWGPLRSAKKNIFDQLLKRIASGSKKENRITGTLCYVNADTKPKLTLSAAWSQTAAILR